MLNERILKELELYEEEYGKIIDKEIVSNAFNTFSSAHHSGFSGNYAIIYLYALVDNYKSTYDILAKTLSECTESEELAMQKLMVTNILETYNQIISLDPEDQKAVIKLLASKPLTPLYGTDDEWEDISNFFGKLPENKVGEYQNKRDSSVFKTVYSNGISICTKVDSVRYSDDGGLTSYTTNMFSMGRKQITFPYVETEPTLVYLYKPDNDCVPYILTDPETIEKVRQLNLSENK